MSDLGIWVHNNGLCDWSHPTRSPYSPENVSRRQSDLRQRLGLNPDPDFPIPDQPPGRNIKSAYRADTTEWHGTGERNVGTHEEHSRVAKGSHGQPRR